MFRWIPGFRSHTIWKRTLAIGAYGVLLVLLVSGAAPLVIVILLGLGVYAWRDAHKGGRTSAAPASAPPAVLATPGVLPSIVTPHLLTRPGEVAHFETRVELVKDVIQRERRGGYSGVSLHVARGMTYHVGQTHSHSVVTGHKIEVEDNGVLVITSRRAVFVGLRSSLEMPLDRLLNVTVFKDGVQFHISGRQGAPILRFKGKPLEQALHTLDGAMMALPAKP